MAKKQMVERGKRSRDKEREWREILDEQRRSGESVRGFCRERGLKEAAFYWWRREIERRDRENKTTRTKTLAARSPETTSEIPVLAPVVMTGERNELNFPERSVAIEIELHGGTVVRVPGGATGKQLGMVLDVLGRSRC